MCNHEEPETMIKKYSLLIIYTIFFIACIPVKNEEEKVISDTFIQLIGEKYYKRDILKKLPGFIEHYLENKDYDRLYRLDTLLYPFKISKIIEEPIKSDEILKSYYDKYNQRIDWLKSNNDSLRLIVYVKSELGGIEVGHLKSSFNLDSLNINIVGILNEVDNSKKSPKKINLHNKRIGRFEISHEIENYENSFKNGLDINPFEGYREIGYMKISRVLFNNNQTIGIYFVTKMLYYDSCIELIKVEKENNQWMIKEIIEL